ncbi:Crp/Fnr family transcriptional regulator [Paludibacterium purpuratum]|uniref:CRP-like cAMP-binding protein n=1 Tax=Paludibacterium purpuratum TaxID=1144873 RepID=A0A4R7B7E9_9NEIS|nr:cyclic nucleotide-binding domain-containing protein [Paludibacterium purpuratum]TDR80680.1 CRP-like cAMP-binding protein [Paludibacterium purpuratum]
MGEQIAAYYEHFRLDRFIPPELIGHFKLQPFDKGESICEVGQPIDSLSFLVEGRAKVFMPMENARQLLLCFYEPLQMLGDLELFEAEPRTVTGVQALTPCLCLKLKRDIVMTQLADNPVFLRQMCLSLGRKLGRVNRNSALNMLHPVENRLASYILGTANRTNGVPAEFSGNLTQIADFLGTSFRHVHRTLQKFCTLGFLAKDRTRYAILNEPALQKLAVGIFVQPSGLG